MSNMHTTKITRTLAPAGFVPAGKLRHSYHGLLPVLALCAATAMALHAQTFTTLFSFDGTDGEYPAAALVQATNGDLYGTTEYGGANANGTVFKITPIGTLTVLYSFCAQSGCTDGERPSAGLIQATNGDFHGTTSFGGANCASSDGCGTVFKITPSGALKTLYSFCAQSGCTDGESPFAGLIQATGGDLYGTTSFGGPDGEGTIFKMNPGGTLTTLQSSSGTPYGGLIQATNGNLYGTTYNSGANGLGTVFEITPSGMLTTIYSFGATDGDLPVAGLVQATKGDFYGTTSAGGDSCGGLSTCGTVFSLSVGLGPFVETQTTSGKVGAVVKILGNELTGATGVSFNGIAAEFKGSARFLITTNVPAGTSTGTVQVMTPGGTLASNVPFR